jgi:hypothetical protein
LHVDGLLILPLRHHEHPPLHRRLNFPTRHGESLARQRDEFCKPANAVFQRRSQFRPERLSVGTAPSNFTTASFRSKSASAVAGIVLPNSLVITSASV